MAVSERSSPIPAATLQPGRDPLLDGGGVEASPHRGGSPIGGSAGAEPDEVDVEADGGALPESIACV